MRTLVDRKLIPDDVVIQVLVQCREHLIKRTFESLKGIKKAIVHIYNSTSTLQRDVVFHKDKEEIKEMRWLANMDAEPRSAEYCPRALRGQSWILPLISTAVQETWGATKEEPHHHQSALHGGDDHAERICGSD